MIFEEKKEFIIDFPQLSQNDYDFLEARVLVKKCPACNKRASISKIENGAKIEKICCERFAKIIGNSISTRNINDLAIHIRGKILNTFTTLESWVDAIIFMCTLQFKEDFKINFEKDYITDLSMREKKQLFKICLERYNILTGSDINKIWGHFCNIVDARNHLAHWCVDTSQDAIDLFHSSKRIKLLKLKSIIPVDDDIFNAESTTQLVTKIESLAIDITVIYNYFRNYRNELFG